MDTFARPCARPLVLARAVPSCLIVRARLSRFCMQALATPEPALSTAGYCQQYAGKSCCTAATANKYVLAH